MLFVQIVVVVTLVAVLVLLHQIGQKQREVQIQSVVVIGELVVVHARDACSRETLYRLAVAPQGMKAPTVVLRCSYDGDTDIRFEMTPGRVPVGNLAAHKLALLEAALPDIKGRLVDKKA